MFRTSKLTLANEGRVLRTYVHYVGPSSYLRVCRLDFKDFIFIFACMATWGTDECNYRDKLIGTWQAKSRVKAYFYIKTQISLNPIENTQRS